MSDSSNSQVAQISEELNYLRQQTASLSEQRLQLNQILGDFSNSKVVLNELREGNKTQELLIPLPGRIYLKGNANSETVFMDVGRGTILPLSVDDASKQLNEKISNIKTGIENMDKQIFQLQTRMVQLEANLNSQQNFGVTPDSFSYPKR